MAEEVSSAFQRKLAERRARQAAAEEAKQADTKPATGDDYSDVIPEDTYELTDADRELDRVIANIDILDAYSRWCGKMTPKVLKGQRENVMISCPKPTHADKNPSAAVNLDKQVWSCYACGEGGDIHDIAAYHFGYPVPMYKVNGDFHKLRVAMAADYGYTIQELPGGVTYLDGPNIDSEPTVPLEDQIAPVVEIYDSSAYDNIEYPSLDWQSIVPQSSFLDIYMKQTMIDDVAEEYHFWNGLLAVGFALGRNARLYDLVPVYGNLFVCTIGASGSGKSKARYHLAKLLQQALPHDWSDPSSRGVHPVNAPGSAEVLIHNFDKSVPDPTNPKKIFARASVTGMIDYNELSSLMSRSNRIGSALKPTLMQFYDMEDTIETSSMTTGKKEAFQPFASALTTTQPASLHSILEKTDDDSGFLNRWVFVAGPEKKKVAIGGARVDIEPAVMPLRRILAWSGTFREDEFVEWSPDAVNIFTDFFDDVLMPAKRSASSALLTRIDLLMKKLCLLLTANKLEKLVSGETVKEVISMYDYIVACYTISETEMTKTFGSEMDDAILAFAHKRMIADGKGVTLNELMHSLRRRNFPKDQLLKHIDVLVKLDMLRVQTTPKGPGRPTTRYCYVG